MNRNIPILLLLLLLVGSIVSCKKNSEEETTTTSKASSVAITSFKLASDTNVIANLDSVYFTIDLDKREIYNADSLPLGTKVSKLIANIGYPACSSLKLHVTDGTVQKDSVIDYVSSKTDSIDFTGNVVLTIVSQDETATASYTLKVNVHKMKPDSLYWNEMARQDLPVATSSSPAQQKTVTYNEKVYILVKDTSGAYSLSSTADPYTTAWTKSTVTFGFTPNVDTFTATSEALYIADENGNLYSSADGAEWSSCGVQMKSVIGGHLSYVLGLAEKDGTLVYTAYPMPADFVESAVDEEFPVEGASAPVAFKRSWMVDTQCLILGGVTSSGKRIGSTWGFDGKTWAKISEQDIPARISPVMFLYTTSDTDSKFVVTSYTSLLAIGGFDESGNATNDVYISRDMGVNWKKADNLLQLPSYIPAMGNASCALVSTTYTRSLTDGTDGWEIYPSKPLPPYNWVISDLLSRTNYSVTWTCPYIYLFGGQSASGAASVYNNVWRGVINRLSFKPII